MLGFDQLDRSLRAIERASGDGNFNTMRQSISYCFAADAGKMRRSQRVRPIIAGRETSTVVALIIARSSRIPRWRIFLGVRAPPRQSLAWHRIRTVDYSRTVSLGRLESTCPPGHIRQTDRQARKTSTCEYLMTGYTASGTLLHRSIAVVDSLICIRLVKGRSQRVLIAQILYVSPTAAAAVRLHAARSHSFSPRRPTDHCNSRLIPPLLLRLLCRRFPRAFFRTSRVLRTRFAHSGEGGIVLQRSKNGSTRSRYREWLAILPLEIKWF